MNKIIWLSICVIIVTMVNCRDTYNDITTECDKSVDFTKYKTFSWLRDKTDTINSPYNNAIIRNNIRNYFGLCMSDRGYSFDAKDPDLLMRLVVTNTKKARSNSAQQTPYYYNPYYYGSYYYSPYYNGYYYNGPGLYGDDYFQNQAENKAEHVNGSITLIFIDRKANKTVWSGTAEGDIYDPSLISRNLHPAIHRILEKYPVKPVVERSHSVD